MTSTASSCWSGPSDPTWVGVERPRPPTTLTKDLDMTTLDLTKYVLLLERDNESYGKSTTVELVGPFADEDLRQGYIVHMYAMYMDHVWHTGGYPSQATPAESISIASHGPGRPSSSRLIDWANEHDWEVEDVDELPWDELQTRYEQWLRKAAAMSDEEREAYWRA
jgi:hypothetical protein